MTVDEERVPKRFTLSWMALAQPLLKLAIQRRMALWSIGLLGLFAVSARADDLRLNQIQVIGTHNSYHQRPKPAMLKLAAAFNQEAKSWDYSHAPLEVQLDRGVRSFELDLHLTPNGWEVFHVPLLDDQSSCRKFSDGLRQVRDWSDGRRDHVPISFLLEIKKEGPMLDGRIRRPDGASLDQLDREIRAVFGPDRLITPEDVRRGEETLERAVRKNGWPPLQASRGKVLFILHDAGQNRALYVKDRPSLQGRAMFVNSRPGRTDAAVLVLDNPRDPEIPHRVREGYLVRTRADSTGSTPSSKRREEAFASGAHIVSTDFPPGEAHSTTGYAVTLVNSAPAQTNPINGPLSGQSRPVLEAVSRLDNNGR